jgi:sporulation protein YlmC with PRC-barrel domain
MSDSRYLYVGLSLLDRQIVDRDGRPAAKVDDVELSDDDVPVVSALLCGPAAYGPRLGAHLGSWITAVHRRVVSDHPVRIPWAFVAKIQSAVELTVPRREVGTTRLEDWVNAHFIARIPGAHDASE